MEFRSYNDANVHSSDKKVGELSEGEQGRGGIKYLVSVKSAAPIF